MRRARISGAGALIVAFVIMLLLVGPQTHAQDGALHETFDDPTIPGWEHSPDVTVTGGVAHIPANGFLAAPGAWGDFTLDIRLRRIAGEGDLLITYRATDTISNYLSVHSSGLALGRSENGQLSELRREPIGAPASEWFDLTLQVAGGQHVIALNGQPVIDFTETAPPLPPASVIFLAHGVSVEVDEVTLTGTGQGAPSNETPPGAQPDTHTAPSPQHAAASGPPAYEAGTWVRLGGPPGGLGYDIRMQPDNPDIMYVTDAHAGVHKSVDAGHTWFPVNNGIPPTVDGFFPIFSLTIDPHDYNVLWAGTQSIGHLYRSADGGQTWEARDSGIALEGRSVRGITIDPNHPNVVYVGVEVSSPAWAHQVISKRMDLTKGEVYKSVDAGLTWTRIWEGNNLARYIWVDPRHSNRLFVSTGIFDRDAADSDVPNGVWGGVGILRSDDGGQTWTVLDERNGLGGRYVGSLFMHPDNPDILLAAVSSTGDRPGMYVTYDGGDTWALSLDSQGWGVEAVEVATGNPNVWYAAGEARIWRSDDAGQSWQGYYRIGTADRNAGVPIDLQVDPRDPYRIFVNNYGGGNFLSEDGGETWVDASQGYTGIMLAGDIAVMPGDAQTVLAGDYRSTDGGQTWIGTDAHTASSFRFYPVSDASLPGLIAGDTTGRVWHSLDGGETWTPTQVVDREAESMRSLAVAPSDPTLVYVGLANGPCSAGYVEDCLQPTGGFFRSHDGGYTWEAVTGTPFDGVSILRVAVNPQDSQMLLAGTAYGLFRSADGGTTWQRVESLAIDPALQQQIADLDNPLLRYDQPIIYDVVFDPFDAHTLYAASPYGAVWRSRDDGQTWQQAAAGMDPNEPIYAILPDPNRQGVLYASSGLSGVFYSSDGAATWQKLNDGMTFMKAHGLALSDDGSVLYAGTDGAGVFRLGTP